MKSLCLFILSISALLTAEVNANAQLTVNDAFYEMKSLVGVWQKADVEKPNLIVSFELIANSSVLVETWLHKGKKHSLTMYHLDNESLLATHYCPQGNQPRLNLTKNSTANKLNFSFLDVTNLASSSDSHQHSLGFEFSKDKGKILRKESYLTNNKEDVSELHLVRRK